ncbi:hypothetical protein F4803DRAFT_557613 [Xylaria telfairii]|nr:hypothetical protein F4803DRAFT_557613 [Xylaria telfairii]
MTIRHVIVTAGPWNTQRDLTRAAANLQPSIQDRLKMKWLLNLANQKHEPPKAAIPFWGYSNKTDSISKEEENDTDIAEDLSSDSDDMLPALRQASLSKASHLGDLISKRRKAPAFIVISDDELDKADLPLPASKIDAKPKLRDTLDPARAVASKSSRRVHVCLVLTVVQGIVNLTNEPDKLPAEQTFDSLVHLDKQSEKEIWEFAYAFSGHNPTKTDFTNPEHCHNFQGLGIALKPY